MKIFIFFFFFFFFFFLVVKFSVYLNKHVCVMMFSAEFAQTLVMDWGELTLFQGEVVLF